MNNYIRITLTVILLALSSLLEFTAGVGMARIEYDTYSVSTGAKDGMGRKKYYGPTKGAVSIVYTIR